MKKILHITFDMHIGGTEQVIKNLVEATDKTKYKIYILCIDSPIGPFGEILSSKGYRVDLISRKEGFDISLIFKIRKYIKRHEIDVLHCHQYTPWVYGVFSSLMTGKKVIFTEHGRFFPDRSSWKRRYINPVLVKFTDHISAISSATKQALIKYEFIPESRIDVIYNGIAELEVDSRSSSELRSKLNLSEKDLILGTIARLDPIKNHKLLIAAFAEIKLKYPNVKLIIVGDGETAQDLKNLVNELGISVSVIFTGYQADPVPYLNIMDIFLLSSLSEGTAMTLLEAMCLSKPCIVTDVGGNPEVIKHNVSGLVTPSDNKSQFVAACDLLIADRELRIKYGMAGREIFDNKFTVKAMLNKYMEFF